MNFFNTVKFNLLSMFSTKSEMEALKHKIDKIEKPYDLAIDTLKKCNSFSDDTTAYMRSLIINKSFDKLGKVNVIFGDALNSINAFRETIGSTLTHDDFNSRMDYATVQIRCNSILDTLTKATQILRETK